CARSPYYFGSTFDYW
nr:immunoglobulin heavy chain junction region [Mus musculus]MBK4188524.1 immunoglobulin heavy chain junction region [Mus musculus]MBK4188525.1 immunoglobulin heavy chain junction region [Mus musculus]